MSGPGAARDVLAAFTEEMARHGLATSSPIRADGELHRFHVEGDGPGSKNGFYVLHPDGPCPAGTFGCWKRGIKQNWKANGAQPSKELRAKLAREVEADRRRRRREETRRHEDAAHAAMDRWVRRCRPAPADHPYLARKRVRPHGTRVDDEDKLVVPLSDVDRRFWSLQTIDAQGAKRYMSEGRVRGCLFWIGEPGGGGERVVVAEGFATGASIHEATGLPVAVAFDRTNLEPVARAIQQKWPELRIVVAADDDRETPGNPGLTDARKAADAVGGKVAVPARREPDGRKLDFNDLALEEGAEAVARIILAAFGDTSEKTEREPEADPGPQAQTAGDTDPSEQKNELGAALEELNRRHFVVMVGSRVVVAARETDHELGRERLHFLRQADVKLFYQNRRQPVGQSRDGPTYRDLGNIWLAHPDRPTYRQIALIPKGPVPEGVYNLWKGFGVEPKAGDWSTIEEHLLEVICSQERGHFDWFKRWMAYAVQHPGKPAETCPVLKGLKGTGKGLAAATMRSFFRDHALHIAHPRHLTGNFNSHLADTLFLHVDEAFWAGDKTGEGVLKALVTEPQITIEPKGIDAFQVPNRLKIMITSNSDWVVPATGDERRFFVLDVSDHRKGDRAYFTRLAAAIEGPELAAFLDHLLKLDLSDFDHRDPPHTNALGEQKLHGLNSVQRFWFDCLNHGETVGIGTEGWPETVDVQLFHSAFVNHAHDHGDRHPAIANLMNKELAKLLPEGKGLGTCRPWNDTGKRPRHYELPDLGKARAAFTEAMRLPGGAVAWANDDE